MVNLTTSDITIIVPSIIGHALGALNDYVGLVVLLGIVGGIAISLGALMGAFRRFGK
jgi:hypothetical protein